MSSVLSLRITTTEEVKKKVEQRKQARAKVLTRELEACDILELRNPQAVAEMAPTIFKFLLKEEQKWMIEHTYMSHQTEINDKIRAILVDWIVEAHYKFKLLPETLYITINIIDRFLEKNVVARRAI